MTSDDDRIAYLADGGGGLDAEELAELDELRAMLADPAVWAEPRAGLEDDIVAAIRAEAGTVREPLRPDVEVGPTLDDEDTPPETVAPARLGVVGDDGQVRSPASRTRTRRRWVGGLLAAAAVIVVLGFATVALRPESDNPQFSVALTPTELAPDASGTAEMFLTESGWRIDLDATGLPRLDGGQFYQGWLRNEAGALVPIGTFNEGTDVILWAGVKPSEFSTLTVTREQADNDQASSGQRVLVGTAVANG